MITETSDRHLYIGGSEANNIYLNYTTKTFLNWWSEKLNIPEFTPRLALQLWGTEVGRVAFHDVIWILSILNKLRDTSENIVLTDCRFKNEIQTIQQMVGKLS